MKVSRNPAAVLAFCGNQHQLLNGRRKVKSLGKSGLLQDATCRCRGTGKDGDMLDIWAGPWKNACRMCTS